MLIVCVVEVTHDVTHLSKAKFLSHIGKKTPVFTRFSTVGGEKGSADTARDPRGFAVKFYTEEGKPPNGLVNLFNWFNVTICL